MNEEKPASGPVTTATPAPPPRDHRDGQAPVPSPRDHFAERLWKHREALGDDLHAVMDAADAYADQSAIAAQQPQPAPELAAVEAERDKLQRSCRLLAGVLVSQARSLYGAWIEASRGDLSAMREWVLNGMPDVDDNDPADQWNGTETADEWFDRTQDEGDAPKPQAQAVSSLRALLDHETRITWDTGLPGERARITPVREQAGLEAL